MEMMSYLKYMIRIAIVSAVVTVSENIIVKGIMMMVLVVSTLRFAGDNSKE